MLIPLMIQKYRLSVIKKLAREIEVNPSKKEEAGEVEDLQKDLMRRSAQLDQMQEVLLHICIVLSAVFSSRDKLSKFNIKVLPRKSGRYLRAILGNVDCNILDRNEKYQYKEQYEQFKLIVNLLGGVLAIASYFFDFLVLDKLGMFLIVWYYCTLTIRWVVPAYRY